MTDTGVITLAIIAAYLVARIVVGVTRAIDRRRIARDARYTHHPQGWDAPAKPRR